MRTSLYLSDHYFPNCVSRRRALFIVAKNKEFRKKKLSRSSSSISTDEWRALTLNDEEPSVAAASGPVDQRVQQGSERQATAGRHDDGGPQG
jgi:hypothetical protein